MTNVLLRNTKYVISQIVPDFPSMDKKMGANNLPTFFKISFVLGKERNAYRFGMTWGCLGGRIFLFGWTVSLKSQLLFLSHRFDLYVKSQLLCLRYRLTGARFDDGAGGDNEVQRTMLELINQLDGFDPRGNIKVLMATNRPDTLDPALMRPGRLDRKIEFSLPDLEVSASYNSDKIASIYWLKITFW